MRCRGAIRASIRPSAHVATLRRLRTATCPPRPGLSPSSDAHHQNTSRATCAATTELVSVGRCLLARRRITAVRGQVSVVAIASKGAALSGLEHTTTEASSVVGRTRAVDAEASSCHWPHQVTWRGNLAACLHRFSRFRHGRSTWLDTERLTDCRVFSHNATMWRVASRAMPPWSDAALLARDWPLPAADAR
jgi:hypothetical protein